jgi:hypothetical protein
MKSAISVAAIFAALLPFVGIAQGQPVTQAEAQAFFKRMAEMNSSFDSRYPDLYSPEATVIGRKQGGEKTVVTGAQWQQLLAYGAEKAKKRNDKSTFSNMRYAVQGERMKIQADRYAVRKCYTDSSYYMIVGRQNNGQLWIEEESFELSPPNQCKTQ